MLEPATGNIQSATESRSGLSRASVAPSRARSRLVPLFLETIFFLRGGEPPLAIIASRPPCLAFRVIRVFRGLEPGDCKVCAINRCPLRRIRAELRPAQGNSRQNFFGLNTIIGGQSSARPVKGAPVRRSLGEDGSSAVKAGQAWSTGSEKNLFFENIRVYPCPSVVKSS
jgi:hypothetical protein